MRIAALGALALCACALITSEARAHAPPQVLDLLWRSGHEVVVVTNRGLIFGELDANRFRLLCNEALHITVNDLPSVTLLPDGRVLAATYSGLKATADEGCSWQGVGELGAMQATSLAAHDADAAVVFVSTYAPGQGGVWRSEDGAATFERVLEADDADFVRSLKLASPAQGPATIYASGSALDAQGQYVHYVARSRDAGESWERFPVAVLDSELDVTLLAVSPTDPDVVVAKATSIEPLTVPERLLISRDGGQTFTSPLELLSLAHAELSQDGSTLWVAGLSGLFRSTDLQSFERVAAGEELTFVREHDGELFVAGRYLGLLDPANGIARSTRSLGTIGSFLQLRDVTEAVACDLGSETAYLCETAWLDWYREVLDSSPSTLKDAGIPDAAIDAGIEPDSGMQPAARPEGPHEPSRHTGSGCAASPTHNTCGAVLLALLGLLLGICVTRWRAR